MTAADQDKKKPGLQKYEFSEMRKKLNVAHREIIMSRQYRGARESDVVAWLAEYIEQNFVEKSAVQALQEKLKKYQEISKMIIHCFETHDYPDLEAAPYVQELKEMR